MIRGRLSYYRPEYHVATIGMLHFATGYPWCCPVHGPIVPVIGGAGGRGRYVSVDRGVVHWWRKGPRFIEPGQESQVIWMNVQCVEHVVRVHYNSSQYYPIVPGQYDRPEDVYWHGDEQYPVVDTLLRRLGYGVQR